MNLLQRFQGLLAFLPATLPSLHLGADEFVRACLVEAAASASDVLGADLLSLYPFDAEQQEFQHPPICNGQLHSPKEAARNIHQEEVVRTIMLYGSRYWERIPAGELFRPADFAVREGIASSAGIRLSANKAAVGALFLEFRAPQSFDEETRGLIAVLSEQVALAVEIARLFRKTSEAASRNVSEYVAQELHDGVSQLLAWEVVGRVGAARDRLRTGDLPGLAQDLKVAEEAAQYCAQGCRDIMGLLKTHVVDELGLVEALRSYCDHMLRPAGVAAEFYAEEMTLPIGIKRQLYRIAQAALANVIAHAQARRVTIRLDGAGGQVRLEIADDGRGFRVDSPVPPVGKYGLRGIPRKGGGTQGQCDHRESARRNEDYGAGSAPGRI